MAFDFEIIWRIWGYLPDWRAFGDSGSNGLDLLLAVITTIIQIPAIRDSSVYKWLTIFQLVRFYRVILAVPTMRPLLVRAISCIAIRDESLTNFAASCACSGT